MKSIRAVAALVFASLLLAACQSGPTAADAAPEVPKAEVPFVDLLGFDRQLAASMSAPLPKVEVAFYDRITPSAMPDRLQKWMASVEAGGGSVKVVPPKSTVTAKNPFLLISAATTLWSASKAAKEYSQEAQFRAARAYDAEILLKVDDKGETVVDRVVFAQRKK